jgi:hypothetical protein
MERVMYLSITLPMFFNIGSWEKCCENIPDEILESLSRPDKYCLVNSGTDGADDIGVILSDTKKICCPIYF